MAETLNQPQGATTTTTTAGGSEFEDLLRKEFKPKTDTAMVAIKAGVQTLAEQALATTALVSDDTVRTIEGMIAEIDRKLSEQVNKIIHHPDFQQLEGTWRGVYHLVSNTQTDENLKLKVFNISKKDLGKTLKKFKGTAWDQSPIFKKIYEEGYGSPNGEPFGALLGDYAFDHTPPDVELLGGIAQVAAAAHAPFISSAAPSLMNMDSWQQLGDSRDLTKIFQTAEYAPWRSLRDSADSKYLGLTMPRFLSRMPYGAKTNPVEDFAFEETTDGGAHGNYVWSNASYAFGTNITRAFKEFGWCARIRGVESGGMVEGLACHTFPSDDGGVDMKCPTEVAITNRREAELAKNGMMPLSHFKNTDYAVFMGAQSLNKPAEFDDPDATANANLGARLQYLFATSRFAHFLNSYVLNKVGSFKERADMERALNKWILKYVEPDSANASEDTKARKPLAAAEVFVKENPSNPGYYSAEFFLRPHYQLEGLTISLRLVSKLKSAKAK